ncbi:MAG: hypothetical protein U5K36_05990 [Roseovarius sp.]|nr:hypothetical protein [Roseovarius sp.]
MAIPVHLSLRRDEGRLVLNTRDATGAWAAERPHRVALSARAVTVVVRFTTGGVSVTLDGTEVLRAPPPDRAIAFLDCDGPSTCSTWCRRCPARARSSSIPA